MKTRKSYHPASVWLHWLMFVLIAVALFCIEVRGYTDKSDALHQLLRNWHIDAGLLVLLAVVVRILCRLRLGGPAPLGAGWQARAASAMHGLLYLVMLLLPLTGILFSQAGGRTVALFGWVLPPLVAVNPALKDLIKPLHEFLGNALYYLVALHVLAALWHHFIVRDDTLRRMKLPPQ